MAKDLKNLSAFELGNLIEFNKSDPISILEFYIENYRNAGFNIQSSFVNLLEKRARKEAESAWKRQKDRRRKGLLDGVPISWKDMIDLKDFPGYAGSKLVYEIRKSEKVKDATVVGYAKKNGLVSLAKTSTVEFAFGGIGININCPLPKIIINKDEYVAGGSSTGAAVAVSNNLVPISIGTDTAGSIRIPAAWNNLVGFKPSFGKIQTQGLIPLSRTYDTIGIICRCVKDAQLCFNVLANKKYNFKSFKIDNIVAIKVQDFNFERLENKHQEKFNLIYKKFSENGINLISKKFPEFDEVNDFISYYGSIVNYEAWNYWKKIIMNNPNKIDPNVLSRLKIGSNINHKIKLKITSKVNKIKNILHKKMEGSDVLILPTISFKPPKVKSIINKNKYNKLNTKVLDNTRIVNIFNMCAITIPIRKNKNNWLSLSILSSYGNDTKLLYIAEKFEKILDKQNENKLK